MTFSVLWENGIWVKGHKSCTQSTKQLQLRLKQTLLKTSHENYLTVFSAARNYLVVSIKGLNFFPQLLYIVKQ